MVVILVLGRLGLSLSEIWMRGSGGGGRGGGREKIGSELG